MNIQMQMPERVQLEETGNPNHGKLVLQPLEMGYGVTIGNSLRRVLLSSIPGTAIVGVKISDVLHEFQTIPGVVEDVSEIILNLKNIRLKTNQKNAQKVNFRLTGPCIWTGKDIQDSSNAEDAELDIELRIGKGKGYVPAEDQQIPDSPMGMLPIDAIFTPIKNVLFSVEPYRVGQKTDYEKLILDIITDGTISPLEAVHNAAKIMLDHIKYFITFEEVEVEVVPQEVTGDEVKEAERNKLRKTLLTPVEELELSVRAHNCLKAANIHNLAELVMLQESELLKFRNFGRKSLAELSDVVHHHSLEFGMNVEKILKEDTTKTHEPAE
jgi:DNA-directed RNA polymerase subunit alpha